MCNIVLPYNSNSLISFLIASSAYHKKSDIPIPIRKKITWKFKTPSLSWKTCGCACISTHTREQERILNKCWGQSQPSHMLLARNNGNVMTQAEDCWVHGSFIQGEIQSELLASSHDKTSELTKKTFYKRSVPIHSHLGWSGNWVHNDQWQFNWE